MSSFEHRCILLQISGNGKHRLLRKMLHEISDIKLLKYIYFKPYVSLDIIVCNTIVAGLVRAQMAFMSIWAWCICADCHNFILRDDYILFHFHYEMLEYWYVPVIRIFLFFISILLKIYYAFVSRYRSLQRFPLCDFFSWFMIFRFAAFSLRLRLWIHHYINTFESLTLSDAHCSPCFVPCTFLQHARFI